MFLPLIIDIDFALQKFNFFLVLFSCFFLQFFILKHLHSISPLTVNPLNFLLSFHYDHSLNQNNHLIFLIFVSLFLNNQVGLKGIS